MNDVTLIGYIGMDPKDFGKVAAVTMYTEEEWVDDKGTHKLVEWHRCKAFGKLAEIVMAKIRKGDQVIVKGKLATNSYEKNGKKISETNVHIITIRRTKEIKEATPEDFNF
jgi:single-strand DNA-binding protein